MNITCQLLGGLGNMLFSLATTYAIAKEKNLVPHIHLDHKGYLHTSPIEYLPNIFRNFKIINNIENYYIYNEPTFTYFPISVPDGTNIKLNGHFQSEKYFSKYRNEILNLFSPTQEIESYIFNKYKNLNEYVSIHVRRGNYLHLSHIHPTCNLEYYYTAINHFKDCEFLIFSDDINYCKQSFIGNKFHFIENESDLIDIYLMSMCSHNIISNSTFSWWGAWLNNTNNKVICPSKWFEQNNYNSKDIIPDRWFKI